MKHFSKLFLSMALLFVVAPAFADDDGTADCKFTGPRSIIIPRPSYLNSAALSFSPWLYNCSADVCDTCATFGLGYRFSRTYKEDRITKELFGVEEGILKFTGSLVKDRVKDGVVTDGSFLADYFGLDPLYKGSITFKPRISRNQVDFAMHWELGGWFDWMDCAYFGLNMTLEHAKWELRSQDIANNVDKIENVRTTACSTDNTTLPLTNKYEGYMSIGGNTFHQKIEEALTGKALDTTIPAWTYGKFNFDENGLTDTNLANVDLILGYDFARCDDYHFGAFLKTVAPTGTKMDEEFVKTRFNTLIGNGRFWEFGGGISAHWNVWECDSQCFSVYLDGSVTHLFKKESWRTFDFKDRGANSAYMLLKEYDEKDGVYTYKSLLNGVDYATRKIESSFDVQGDATLRFQYENCGWIFGFGYNIYGRSEEKINNTKFDNEIDKKYFAFKGMTGVAYYDAVQGQEIWKTLNASATDYADAYGQFTGTFASPAYVQNSDYNTNCNVQNIDNPGTAGLVTDITWDKLTFAHRNATPKIIDDYQNYIDFDKGKIPSFIVHKIFGNIGYQWEDCDWQPFVSIYGDCDFARHCDTQVPVMWTIGIQGGISF